MQGIVRKWIVDRRFGFIEPAAGGEHIFCHVSALAGQTELMPGQQVEFDEELDQRRGRYHATNVRVLSAAETAQAAR